MIRSALPMTTQIVQINGKRRRMMVCGCDQHCLDTICLSSDSGVTVRFCWCSECAERRATIERRA